MKQIALCITCLLLSFFIVLTGCGKKQGADKASHRMNFAVVTIKDAFWREQGFNSLSNVGSSRDKRKQAAAKILYAPETKDAGFFFRQSWYVKAGDKIVFEKKGGAEESEKRLQKIIPPVYPMNWKGTISYGGLRRFFKGYEVYYDGTISYYLTDQKTIETVPDKKRITLNGLGDADMILRVVQGDTSIWTIISLAENTAKPLWKIPKKD